MDVYIAKLRKYLKDDPKIEIVNIHGNGFQAGCAGVNLNHDLGIKRLNGNQYETFHFFFFQENSNNEFHHFHTVFYQDAHMLLV
jgi:hypothetical protein